MTFPTELLDYIEGGSCFDPAGMLSESVGGAAGGIYTPVDSLKKMFFRPGSGPTGKAKAGGGGLVDLVTMSILGAKQNAMNYLPTSWCALPLTA